MDELVAANSGRVSGESLFLNELNMSMEFTDCIEGRDSKVGEKEDKVPNVVYDLSPVEDPKLTTKDKPKITFAQTNMHFTYSRKPYKFEDYNIYPCTSLKVARKQVRLILC